MLWHASDVVRITPLHLPNLKSYEEKHTDGSNHFIYTRFLIPHLMNYEGWALFCDCDFLWLADIKDLIAQADVVVEVDRRAAIRRGLGMARKGDIVLIAGKGHEAWQHWRGQRLPFDDVRVAREELP